MKLFLVYALCVVSLNAATAYRNFTFTNKANVPMRVTALATYTPIDEETPVVVPLGDVYVNENQSVNHQYTVGGVYAFADLALGAGPISASIDVEKVGASFVVTSTSGSGDGIVRPIGTYAAHPSYQNDPPTVLTFGQSLVPDGMKPIWELDDATLTANLYREGVDKVVAALGGAGGGGSAGGSADSAAESQREQKARDERRISSFTYNVSSIDGSFAPVDITMVNGMHPDALATRELVELTVKNSRANFSIPDLNDNPGTGSYVINFRGRSLNLDPMAYAPIASFAAFMRGIIAWFAVVCFEWWLWREFKELFFAAATLPQARGNPVIGGTGGQATAFIAAVAISAILISLPAAWWAYADSDFGFIGIGQNPIEGPLTPDGYAKHLTKAFIPVGTILAVVVQMFIARKFGVVLHAGVATVIRFVIP